MAVKLSKDMVLQRLAAGLPGGNLEAMFTKACQRAGVAVDQDHYHPAEVALMGKALMEMGAEALSQIDPAALEKLQPQED